MKHELKAPALHSINCVQCALKQLIDTAELLGLNREQAMPLMFEAVEHLSHADENSNNAVLIDDCFRIVTRATGNDDPYHDVKIAFNEGMMRLYPEVKRHVHESDDPLRAAVRASIAGNLIDLAALGWDVTMERATQKVYDIDREGLYIDACDSLSAALSKAQTLLVLGDNCGEIVMDKLLIETILELYPHLKVQYGVRGVPSVNDVTREDAAMVHMEEVAEIIDNGDTVLSTILPRCSQEFIDRFYAADVVICKGMGNYEGLLNCDRGNMWFLLIAKCKIVAGLSGSPLGSILCMEKK